MKLGLPLAAPINFEAFANVEPLVVGWMIVMFILILYLPFHFMIWLWRRLLKRPRASSKREALLRELLR